jgi:hypothetical protein
MSRATPAKMAHTSKGIREVAQINIAITTEALKAEGAHSAMNTVQIAQVKKELVIQEKTCG